MLAGVLCEKTTPAGGGNGSDSGAVMTAQSIKKMTVPVIKNHLHARGLSIQGLRAELVERLETAVAAAATATATATQVTEIDNMDKLAELIQTEVPRVELPSECITIEHSDGQLITLSPVATLCYNFTWTVLREIQTAVRKKLPNRQGGRPNLSGNERPKSKRQASASPCAPLLSLSPQPSAFPLSCCALSSPLVRAATGGRTQVRQLPRGSGQGCEDNRSRGIRAALGSREPVRRGAYVE